MIGLIIWFWALLCPNHNHTVSNHGSCQMVHLASSAEDGDPDDDRDDDDDTGGDTGNFPPKPPVPPPFPGN